MTSLLGNKLIEHGAVILVDLLHLVDVAGHLLHGFQGLCRHNRVLTGPSRDRVYWKNAKGYHLMFPHAINVTPKCRVSARPVFIAQRLIAHGLPTGEVVVFLAVAVGKGDQLPQQQGVLEHPLHWFNQVGLQGGRVLLGGVPGIEEFFEGLIRLG